MDAHMVEYGVVHGRFQIVHNDHVKYILAAGKRCRRLIVGITNADPLHMRPELADSNRSRPQANPLNYFERYCMLREVLIEQRMAPGSITIVPFPINYPQYCRYYVPEGATFFITVYDKWGEEKEKRLKALKLKTEVIWKKPLTEKGITATMVRQSIIEGGNYSELVPAAVYRLIEEWNIAARLKALKTDTGEKLH
jgi:nicotinamide-nucleotide adenylyltransferase